MAQSDFIACDQVGSALKLLPGAHQEASLAPVDSFSCLDHLQYPHCINAIIYVMIPLRMDLQVVIHSFSATQQVAVSLYLWGELPEVSCFD
jgi:hypothetical protein